MSDVLTSVDSSPRVATMRTTVRLDEDIYRVVKTLAEARGRTFGEVLSELARKGLEQPARIRYEEDLPVFEVHEGAPVITPDLVNEIRDDEG
jgi:hypothetical protein